MVVNFRVIVDRDDHNTPIVITVRRERVPRVGSGTPTIVARDTHHPVVKTYFHEVTGEDLVDMGLLGFAVLCH